MLLEIYKTFLYITISVYKIYFKSLVDRNRKTYSNWVACTYDQKKPLATFIVRGNQIWVEACFCLIASIRLVDGKKPQDAKIVKSEDAPPYMEKHFYRLFLIRSTYSFIIFLHDNFLTFCLHVLHIEWL